MITEEHVTKQTSCIEKSRKKSLSQMKSTWRNLLLDCLPQVRQHDRIPGVGRRRTSRRPGGRMSPAMGAPLFKRAETRVGVGACFFVAARPPAVDSLHATDGRKKEGGNCQTTN